MLTFAISAGDAFEAPSWRAILPELVIKKMILATASAIGGLIQPGMYSLKTVG